MPDVAGEEALVDELVRGIRNGEQVTLLVGSGVTAPAVPLLSQILDLAQRYAAGVGDEGDLARALAQARQEVGPAARTAELYVAYRRVFADWVSHGEFDVVAQQAVLAAYRPPDLFASPLATHGIWQRVTLRLGERVENSLQWWELPPGVQAIGRLLARRPDEFGNRVLTTNFDPLVEVAIRTGEGRAVSVPVDQRGRSAPPLGAEGAVRVFHLHGFWRPTVQTKAAPHLLHASAPLAQAPPDAVRAIADLVTGDLVCVVGYGGRDDLVTAGLRAVGEIRRVRVVWALHDPEGSATAEERERLTGKIGPSAAFFHDVDSNRFFTRLAARLDVPAVIRGIDRRRRTRHPVWERELFSHPGNIPPAEILPLLRQLDRRFGWGVDWSNEPQAPNLLFWPIRVRQQPSLIHAVQAVAAGALTARGVRLVVCLDDFGLGHPEEYNERLKADLRRWIRRTDPHAKPEFVLLQHFIDNPRLREVATDPGSLLRPTDPWGVARILYGEHNPSLYTVLAALRVVPNVALRDLEDHAPAIVQALLSKDANRLLTPLTVWSCLHHLLRAESTPSVMTLGGRDEGFFWELWREVFGFGINQLYNPHIKSLTNESRMVRWSATQELRDHLARAHELPGWDADGGYIRWLVQNALLLPTYLASEDPPEFGGHRLDSWPSFAAALEEGGQVLDLLADRVSDFYLGTR